MNIFPSKIRRFVAFATTVCLLLPLFATTVMASPSDELPPVWNGGASEAFEGSGSKNDPYLINTAEDLALLASSVRNGNTYAGKYFKLTRSLRLNDTASFDTWNQTPPQRKWTPIGGYAAFAVNSSTEFEEAVSQYNGLYIRTDNSYQTAAAYTPGTVYYRLTVFNGIFNGDGHEIAGMCVSHTDSHTGLFGVLGNATVQNLTLTSAYVQGNKQAGILAGAVIASKSAEITNVQATGILNATENMGGIIGYAEATGAGKIKITQCSFSGKLQGSTNIGGILGKTGTSSGSVVLSQCITDASITGVSNIGGILGHLTGAGDQILSCKSNSSIAGNSYIGGIVGAAEPAIGTSSISDCQNSGVLLTDHTTGGIVGAAITTTDGNTIDLINCRNIGEIYSSESAGGIVGRAQMSGINAVLRIQGCKNSAMINGTSFVGGIVGYALIGSGTFTVSACENYGNIHASIAAAGGILGQGQNDARMILTMCAVRATIHSDASLAGGIAGKLTSRSGSILLELSGATGSVQATDSVGGIVGELTADGHSSTAMIQNCIAANTLSAVESLGGIAGHLYAQRGSVSATSSLFAGIIHSGCKLYGGISADLHATQARATATITNCYYTQSAASVATHLLGGAGTESITSTEARSEESIRNNENLTGLDPTLWELESTGKHAPTPLNLPIVWEEFQYTVSQNGATLLAYLGRSDIVRVPDRLGGVSVSILNASAFEGSEVIQVLLPDSITAIGEAAFAGCTRLERITLPSSLISIGARAFSGCTALRELRSTSLLSTVLVGSENEPYQALSITRPITLPIQHLYEDGSMAGKTTSLTCYAGDYYSITPLIIKGYRADTSSLSGVAQTADRITVVYRIGTYQLSIRYLYQSGAEAAPAFKGEFQFGEKYSISSPILEGFKADYTLIEGNMDGDDLELVVYYTEIFEHDSTNDEQAWQLILLILSGLIAVCCMCYFVYRYRSIAEQEQVRN